MTVSALPTRAGALPDPATMTDAFAALELTSEALFVVHEGVFVYSNPAGLDVLKARHLEQILGQKPESFLHQNQGEAARALMQALCQPAEGDQALQCEAIRLDGQLIAVEVHARRWQHHERNHLVLHVRPRCVPPAPLLLSTPPDRLSEALHHEKEILEMIALDKPLVHILEDVCDRMERLLNNAALCAITLYDPHSDRLSLAAGPALPDAFCAALQNIPAEPGWGAAAAALHYDRLTITQDIALSPLWEQLAGHAHNAGLASCWSLPIKTAFDARLGSVDIYHRFRHSPDDDEQAMIVDASDLIGLAIDKKNMEQILEESEERYRSVVTNLTEGIMVLGAEGQILTCNPSAQRILNIDPATVDAHKHRYFKRLFREDGDEVRVGDDPASHVFRSREALLGVTLGIELADDSVVWLQVNALPIIKKNAGQLSAVLISFTDTTEVRKAQLQLQQMASFDALTGLPNRHQLNQRLLHALSHAERQHLQLAVLFLDLDRFKNVNDTAGHAAGDTLLREVSARLNGCVRAADLLARLGGDEFVIVAEDVDDAVHLKDLAERVLEVMRTPFVIEGNEYHLGTSIGIAIYPQDGKDAATLMRCADSAMYHAKELGRNNYQFFTSELNARAQHRYTLEKNLRRALSEQEFLLFYQPKISLKTQHIVGTEALIRWQVPGGACVLPGEFIPMCEEIGLILPIGRWVLHEACRQTADWRRRLAPELCVSVNISPKQFQDPDLPQFIRLALEEHGLPPAALQLEITESLLMSEIELLRPMFAAIRALGVRIALDDFGTGFSSLSYLQRFPVDNLKIDRSFIHDIPENPDSVGLTHAIIAMARALGMSVTAEGVEKAEQMAFLIESGCQDMQGYLFAQPLPVDALETLLRTPGNLPH